MKSEEFQKNIELMVAMASMLTKRSINGEILVYSPMGEEMSDGKRFYSETHGEFESLENCKDNLIPYLQACKNDEVPATISFSNSAYSLMDTIGECIDEMLQLPKNKETVFTKTIVNFYLRYHVAVMQKVFTMAKEHEDFKNTDIFDNFLANCDKTKVFCATLNEIKSLYAEAQTVYYKMADYVEENDLEFLIDDAMEEARDDGESFYIGFDVDVKNNFASIYLTWGTVDDSEFDYKERLFKTSSDILFDTAEFSKKLIEAYHGLVPVKDLHPQFLESQIEMGMNC